MPLQETTAQPKRPSISHRHSSGSVHFAKSPSDILSSSIYRPKPHRHVVSHPRLGGRVPSYNKNVNKLPRGTAPHPPESPALSPRLGHVKRNSSNLHLGRNTSHAHLRKNHSETSLKKNRSSGHLTKLTRPSSSKHISKAAIGEVSKRRKSSPRISAVGAKPKHEVRFDLPDEDIEDVQDDAWTEESLSQSPNTTRSSTRPNSAISDNEKHEEKLHNNENIKPSENERLISRQEPPTFQPTAEKAQQQDDIRPQETSERGSWVYTNRLHYQSTLPGVGKLTSRLLNRSVSFNAAPKVSEVLATANIETHGPGSIVDFHELATRDANDNELVSRFINATSSSGATHRNSVLRHEDDDRPHDVSHSLSKSASDLSARETPDSGSTSQLPKSSLHTDGQPAQTQQQLWLKREAANVEASQEHSACVIREPSQPHPSSPIDRSSSNGNHDHVSPELRRAIDLTDKEYKRVRMFSNPLVDAITRLQESGVTPKTKLVNRAKGKATSLAKSGDGPHGLSQSLRESKTAKTSGGDLRKPKIMFAGLKGSKDDGAVEQERKEKDHSPSLQEVVQGQESTARDEAREICRRMWAPQPVFSNDA